ENMAAMNCALQHTKELAMRDRMEMDDLTPEGCGTSPAILTSAVPCPIPSSLLAVSVPLVPTLVSASLAPVAAHHIPNGPLPDVDHSPVTGKTNRQTSMTLPSAGQAVVDNTAVSSERGGQMDVHDKPQEHTCYSPILENQSPRKQSCPTHDNPPHPPKPSSYVPAAFLDEALSSDHDSDLSDSAPRPLKKARTEKGAIGISASAIATRKLKEAMSGGTFTPNQIRLDRFKTTCWSYDMHTEFLMGDKWKVHHSVCGKWYTMKEAYDTFRFKAHVSTCRVRLHQLSARSASKDKSQKASDSARPLLSKAVLRTTTMDRWAEELGWSKGNKTRKQSVVATQPELKSFAHATDIPPRPGTKTLPAGAADMAVPAKSRRPIRVQEYESEVIPCPGITASCEPRVPTYLQRTGAQGGGAPTVTALARELFKDKTIVYSTLSEENKETVSTELKHRWTWRNDHVALAVFSTACKKVAPRVGSGMCPPCARVLKQKVFRNALKVLVPDKENYKYLNDQYRSTTLGKVYTRVHGVDELLEDKTSPESVFTRFSLMVQQGKFKGEAQQVLLELVKALVDGQERTERGVGKQNLSYGPALVEFAHTCAITSPQLYRAMQKHLQLPNPRTLGRQRAKLPPFPTDICDRTFEIAKKYIADIGCEGGPVALSCDDTKLHAAWRTYYDAKQQCHFLVGGTGPPRAIADVDALKKILKEAGDKDKATKLRLWCLQPTLPKVPPLIIAAKAIPNSLSAEDLYTCLLLVLVGLIDAGINVVSYSSDGTEVERAVQRLLIQRADMVHTHVIQHPCTGEDIPIRIAVIRGQAIVIVQDSKHAAKTLRNNACTGARALSLGNFLVLFHMLYNITFSPGSPLYHRDVVKLDRQDDNAATRLYASATLDHIIKTHPEYIGLIVYLFVFGELVDAYQNRAISHLERIKMVLRAKFFIQLWRCYLEKAGYPVNRYCISREALDICTILVDGLIALVIVHRDHMGDHSYPFLPWLHSTEACEHVFGECRKLVKDFTHLDFIYMVPRIFILIRGACRFAHTSDPRARAGGYAHTYFDAGDANLALLAVFPSDTEITIATQEAWDEATNLWDLLGVNPPDLFPQATGSSASASTSTPASAPTLAPTLDAIALPVLPSVAAWFTPGEDPVFDHHAPEDPSYASAHDYEDDISGDEYEYDS
ncbi:hypothetical protein TRAPUB_9877, partial [Trametes pubescens]